ncbi:MAG: hypothetical protein KKH68_11555 [Proteobacteria bacterium]|nr:hypothetical protein [Pseudomonadota bacterium]
MNLTIRWITIGLIWAGALIATYWNIDKIGLIMTEIEKEEVFRLDDSFWSYNSGNISKVLTKRDSLVLPIESIRLGLLSVENSLMALVSKHHFHEVQFESMPEQTGDVGIPINLYFEGPFKEILPWLSTLEQDFPYLPVRHVKITAIPFSKQSKYQFRLYFRYKLSNPEDTT